MKFEQKKKHLKLKIKHSDNKIEKREGLRDHFIMKFERNRYGIYFVQIS